MTANTVSQDAANRSKSKLFVFVDTNCFIQVRDLKDLPWAAEFPNVDSFEILVAPIVIDELDEFKSNRDGRRRDRARLALSLIEKASSSEDFRVELRTAPLKIAVRILPGTSFDWNAFPILDKSRPDDQLVASILSFSDEAILLSHDTGPIVRARLVGRKAFKVPADWLLPQGTDSLQRDLQKALKELELLRSTRPTIEASFLSHTLVRPRLEPLSFFVQDSIFNYGASIFPKKELQSTTRIGGGFAMEILSQSQIDTYDRSYASFVQQLRFYLLNLHSIIEKAGRAAAATLHLRNSSATTAEQLIIEYGITKNGVLFANREDADAYFGVDGVPEAPVAPRSILDNMIPTISEIGIPRLKAERSPIDFYWLHRPDPADKECSVQCAQFRPQRVQNDQVWIAPSSAAGDYGGHVELVASVSASNLIEPFEIKASFDCIIQERDWTDTDVQVLLPQWIQDFFKQE